MSQSNLYNPFALPLPRPSFLNGPTLDSTTAKFNSSAQPSTPGLPSLTKPSFSPVAEWRPRNPTQEHPRRFSASPIFQPRFQHPNPRFQHTNPRSQHPNPRFQHTDQFRGYTRQPWNANVRSNSFQHQNGGKRDLQQFPFFCNRCDRSFKTEDQYNGHVSEHVTCGIDGCTFVSHPKVVEKHIAMQHETGLALKVMSIITPEDIAKWREERKKRFPTVATVAQKQAAKEEQTLRGELLDDRPERFPIRTRERGRGRGGRGRGRGRGRNRNNYEPYENPFDPTSKPNAQHTRSNKEKISEISEKPTVIPKSEIEDEMKGNLPAFRGTASILNIKKRPMQSKLSSAIEGEISDEDVEINAKFDTPSQERTPNPLSDSKPLAGPSTALSSIMCSYGSDSDESLEEGELEEEPETQKSEASGCITVKEQRPKSPIKEATKEITEPKANETSPRKPNKRKRKHGKRGHVEEAPSASNQPKPSNAPIRRKRLTLLQKLLQGEIRHERNVILQCVHYIVQNDFFGIGK